MISSASPKSRHIGFSVTTWQPWPRACRIGRGVQVVRGGHEDHVQVGVVAEDLLPGGVPGVALGAAPGGLLRLRFGRPGRALERVPTATSSKRTSGVVGGEVVQPHPVEVGRDPVAHEVPQGADDDVGAEHAVTQQGRPDHLLGHRSSSGSCCVLVLCAAGGICPVDHLAAGDGGHDVQAGRGLVPAEEEQVGGHPGASARSARRRRRSGPGCASPGAPSGPGSSRRSARCCPPPGAGAARSRPGRACPPPGSARRG